KNVKEITLGAYEHQIYPFDKLVEELNVLRDTSRSPVFDVMLVLQNIDNLKNNLTEQKLGNLKVRDYINREQTTSKFDLAFYFREEGEQINVVIQYNTDLFYEDTVEEIFNDFKNILTNLPSSLDKSIDKLCDDLNIYERGRIVINSTFTIDPIDKIFRVLKTKLPEIPLIT